MFNLSNKKVLLVGGAGLIGTAIYKLLKQQEAEVTLIDTQFGVGHDFTNPENVHYTLNHINPNVFINASYPRDPQKHLDCFILCNNIVSQHLSDNTGGVIVNLCSIYNVVGPNMNNYSGTNMTMPNEYAMVKGAIVSHSRCLSTKHGNRGVRVNCVSAGGVYDGQDPKFLKKYEANTPLARMAHPDDIAGPVVFLASDAAKYITGQNIIVDGGYTSW